MSQGSSSAVVDDKMSNAEAGGSRGGGQGGAVATHGGGSRPSGGGSAGGGRARSGGFFEQYKPDQGKWTRLGTFVGLGLLVAWGAIFLRERLQIYRGNEWWNMVVTDGIPLLFAVALGVLAWWVSYSNRTSSDFMIATEGEMKKVSWSTRRELIGSTKVVIMFTILLAVLLFFVDLGFQELFSRIGVLKVS